MKKIILIFLMIIAGILNYCPQALRAEETKADYDLGRVVVTATKTEQSLSEVSSDVTVISEDEIEQGADKTVARVLESISGVSFAQSGSSGGTTSIYMRGAKPGHTIVLIDGVKVNDPMSVDRSFNFAHLTTANLERIEVVRGAQSTLYGSDAMAGVVNIITKKGRGAPKWNTTLEAGSHNNFFESAALSGSNALANYSFSLSHSKTDGISQAKDGTENDAYSNTSFSSRVGVDLFNNSELSFITRYTDANFEIDDGAYNDDPNYTSGWKQVVAKMEFNQNIMERWNHKISFSFMNMERKDSDSADAVDTLDDLNDKYAADDKNFEWQHNFSIFEKDTETLGIEYEEERGTSDYYSAGFVDRINRRSADNRALYFQNQLKVIDNLTTVLGLRLDNHSQFGGQTTYKSGAVYAMERTLTRLKANWATGFKAPTLYQLYSSYGSASLNPEKSRSYDFGLEQGLSENKVNMEITYFHNDFKDMVEWNAVTSKYKNIGRAKASGFEVASKFKIAAPLTLSAYYTYTRTKDKDTGLELARRPQHQAKVNANWQFSQKVNMDLLARYIGGRWNDYLASQKVKRYTVVDIAANYNLNSTVTLFSRVTNLFDREYEEVRGYNTLGRAYYAGIKAEF